MNLSLLALPYSRIFLVQGWGLMPTLWPVGSWLPTYLASLFCQAGRRFYSGNRTANNERRIDDDSLEWKVILILKLSWMTNQWTKFGKLWMISCFNEWGIVMSPYGLEWAIGYIARMVNKLFVFFVESILMAFHLPPKTQDVFKKMVKMRI